MPDGGEKEFTRNFVDFENENTFVWVGVATDDELETLYLSIHHQAIVGQIETKEASYEIKYLSEDKNIIRRVDRSQYPENPNDAVRTEKGVTGVSKEVEDTTEVASTHQVDEDPPHNQAIALDQEGEQSGEFERKSKRKLDKNNFNSFWALAEVKEVTDLKNGKLDGTSLTPVYEIEIQLKKGDYLDITGQSQLTEDNLKTTALTAAIYVNSSRRGPYYVQYVSRGGGRNHHMGVHTIGRYLAEEDGIYVVSMKVKSSINTDVTVDKPYFGSLVIKRYQHYTSEEMVEASPPYFFKALLNGELKKGISLIAKKGYQEHRLSRLNMRTSSSDDLMFVSSQGTRKWNPEGKKAEMVVDEHEYYAGNKRLKLYRMGENVGHTLKYGSINLNPLIRLSKGSSYLDFNTYGGNNSGFYQYYDYSFLQGLVFSRDSSVKGTLLKVDYSYGKKTFILHNSKKHNLMSSTVVRARESDIIHSTAMSSIHFN